MGVGIHQESVLSPLPFITVLEALTKEFRTCCPWELLISAEYMEDLLGKMNILKILKWRRMACV